MKKIWIFAMVIAICISNADATSQRLFNFASTFKSGSTINDITSSYSITIEASGSYIEVPAIPTVRSASGLVQSDYNNKITYNEALLNFGTYAYYVVMQVYIFSATYDAALFCLPIRILDNSNNPATVTWCVRLVQTTDLNFAYDIFDGTNKYEATGTAITSYVLSGWQYVGFSIVFGAGTPPTVTGNAYVYDSGGTYISNNFGAPVQTANSSIPLSTFGRIQIGTTITNQFVGAFTLIEICDAVASCPTTAIPSRSTFVTTQLNIYEDYWDLTSGTTFDGYVSNNPCLRKQQYASLTNIYFTHNSNEQPPYPTNRGWFSLRKDVSVFASGVDFSNSHQMSMEFEIFPIDTYYSMKVYPYEDWNNPNRMHIDFTFYGAYTNNPYNSTTSLILALQQWNKVFISVAVTDTSNQMRVSVYSEPLLANSASSGNFYSFKTDGSYTSYMLTGTKMNLSIQNAQSIIRSMKYYKWAINSKTVQDMYLYKYSGDVDYNFQVNAVNNYFNYFSALNWNTRISNSDNACLSYVTSNTNVCPDISQKDAKCTSGYEVVEDFCLDKCGDGKVQLNPQMAQCDDGNNNSGDGCSKDCYIEAGYSCDILSNQNNKSYCYKMCGNGKYDPANNEFCDDGNYVSGDGCKSDCTIETGFKCTNYATKASFCYPNCGDGIRDTSPTVEQCDDGNNMDLDGCSGQCQVEFNYVCTPGATADVCTTIYPAPTIISDSFDSTKLQIIVGFDQVMMNQTISSFDANVDVSGPNSPYTVSWSTSFSQKQLVVSFSVSPLLIGGVGETILLQLITVTKFKSQYQISMKSPKQFTYTVSALAPNQSTQSGGSGASYMFIITMLLSLGISILTGGSMELMWSLANTLQILFYFGMLNLYFTPDLLAVYSFMKYSNFDNPVTDYLSQLIVTSISFVSTPISSNFGSLGFSSTDIIANCLDKLLMIFLIGMMVGLLTLLFFITRKKSSRFANFIKKKDMSIRYEFLSRFFVELTITLSVASLINIVYGQRQEAMDYIAYVLAVLCMAGLFLFSAYLMLYPFKHYTNICEYPDKHERHCMLFLDFKRDHIRRFYFFGYFVLHRIGLAIIIVCMLEFPVDQCTCIIFICLWFFIMTFNSYKESLPNFLHTFNSIVLICYSGMMPLFISCENPQQLLIAGYTCIGIIIVFFAVNWVLIIPVTIVTFYRKCKECCRKKTREEIQKEERLKRINKRNLSVQSENDQVKRDPNILTNSGDRKEEQKWTIMKIKVKNTSNGPKNFEEVVAEGRKFDKDTPRFPVIKRMGAPDP